MQRLSGIDPMFIYSDTPETPMEIAYACVFDPATAEGGYTFERVRDVLVERIPGLRPFRRRLVTVPFGLDHPRWVDDPDFDLSNHLFRVALPAPGGHEQFTDMVAKVMSRPLQPDQPPWEMHVIEDLAAGRVGLIAKVHHSVVDGVAGAALMAELLDLTPEGRSPVEHCTPWIPARLPSQARLVTEALPNMITRPVRDLARGPRDRPHRRAHGPLRHERRQRTRLDSPGRAQALRPGPLAAPGRLLHPAGHARGQGHARALQRDGQRRRAGRVLGRAADPPDRVTTTTWTARSWRSCRSRSARTGPRMRAGTPSRPCSCRSPTTSRRRWSACAR